MAAGCDSLAACILAGLVRWAALLVSQAARGHPRQRIAAIWADHGLIVGPPIEVAAAPAASRASPGAQGRRPGAREVTMHA